MKRVLVTGSRGQLATEFISVLPLLGYQVLAPSEEQFDIASMESVQTAFEQYCPEVVINCAAFTDVERAESEREKAYKVNATGPRLLAEACSRSGALLMHFSTDYVFDGTKEGYYTEEDDPHPLNYYGESKLAGDRYILESGCRFLIFRTSWVFGRGPQNFLYKLQQWAEQKPLLRVVSDQIAVPTYTSDIAAAAARALDKGLSGLYNLTNSGYASRYEVARYLFDALGKDKLVLPVTSDHFPSAARRPYFSVLSCSKFETEAGYKMAGWQDAIKRYVKDAGLQEVPK